MSSLRQIGWRSVALCALVLAPLSALGLIDWAATATRVPAPALPESGWGFDVPAFLTAEERWRESDAAHRKLSSAAKFAASATLGVGCALLAAWIGRDPSGSGSPPQRQNPAGGH